MKCVKCKTEKDLIRLPSIEPICKGCFLHIIEKRVRKRIRINKLFKKEDCIVVGDQVSLYLIKSIIKGLPVKIFIKKRPTKEFIRKNKINKIIIQWTIDDETNTFLESLFLNKKQKPIKEEKADVISIMRDITDKEAETFAKISKIAFKPNKKNPQLSKMLDNLEKRYPEVKFSLSKSIKQLK